LKLSNLGTNSRPAAAKAGSLAILAARLKSCPPENGEVARANGSYLYALINEDRASRETAKLRVLKHGTSTDEIRAGGKHRPPKRQA